MVLKFIEIVALLVLSGLTYADKEVFYSDKDITIYTDNTVVYTGSNRLVKFKESSTWVEEDFFTQQDKYCEVGSKYVDKLKKGLNTRVKIQK